jgi:hypothetical protein
MDMNKIAQMSCNPAVGGIAKGQIVREIDALGGQMGLVTDATAIQFRMLNRSKGPAVWSPRAQCDRGKFIWKWRSVLDETPHLDIWQDQADELIVENGEAVGVKTIWGCELRAKSVIITANLRFVDEHRSELQQQYKTFDDFRKRFEVPQSLIDHIKAEGDKKNIKPKDDAELEATLPYLRTQLKALIARDLWNMDEYYAIINDLNDTVQRALKLIK